MTCSVRDCPRNAYDTPMAVGIGRIAQGCRRILVGENLAPGDQPYGGIFTRAEFDRGGDLRDHQLMREIVAVALGRELRGPARAETRDTALVELIDEGAIIGVGALPLLLRPGQVQVWLAREEIEPMAQSLLIAADEGVNVIARQVAKADEQLEDLDVAFGRIDGERRAVAIHDRIAGPAGIARSGV